MPLAHARVALLALVRCLLVNRLNSAGLGIDRGPWGGDGKPSFGGGEDSASATATPRNTSAWRATPEGVEHPAALDTHAPNMSRVSL